MLREQLLQMKHGEKHLLQLHLIADTRRRLSVVLEKLKTGFRQIRIETAGNTKPRIPGIDARHSRFAFSGAEHFQELVIIQSERDHAFNCRSDGAGRARNLIVLRAADYVRPKKRAGGTVAENQTQFTLRGYQPVKNRREKNRVTQDALIQIGENGRKHASESCLKVIARANRNRTVP